MIEGDTRLFLRRWVEKSTPSAVKLAIVFRLDQLVADLQHFRFRVHKISPESSQTAEGKESCRSLLSSTGEKLGQAEGQIRPQPSRKTPGA
jgi:hypothetical protein